MCYLLITLSPVLRDAQDCNTADGPKEIQFTDTEIERRDVLNVFLNILTIPANTLSETHDLDICLSLISFLRKYDCGQAIQVLRLCLTRSLIEEEWSAAAIFALGAALDDLILCSAAVGYEERSRRDNKDPKHFGVSDIPVAALEHVPQEYLRGLADAVPRCEGKQCDCQYEDSFQRTTEFENNVWELKGEMKQAREKRRHPEKASKESRRQKKKRTS